MNKNKKKALLISLLLFLICVGLNFFYRPYIYLHKIFDFHIADTFTSWISVPSASLFFWGLSKNVNFKKILFSSLCGFIVYEFLGLTFDWYDIIALLLSAIITYLIYLLYQKHKKSVFVFKD